MSHYETAEQREIRRLRNEIRTLTNTANSYAAANRNYDRQIDTLRRQQSLENDRLMQKLREQQEANRRAQAQAQAQMSAAIRQLDAQVKERERLQNQRITAMQNQHQAELHRLENEFQAEQEGLKGEIRQTRTEMRRSMTQLRTETDQKLRAQKEETQRTIAQVSTKLEGQISEVDRKVNSLAQQIADKEQGEKEIATYWAQEAARMLQQLRETFREQFFDPRRVSVLERRIRQANEDIKGGQYQTSITAGREAFFDALDMKEDLVAAELEWNYWFNAVRTRETQLLEALNSAENRVYEVQTAEGPVTYSNGIDYWTFNQLTIVRNQIQELRDSLQNTEAMTLSQLQEKEEALRALQEQLALVENAAHINVAMSVSRYEVASKIGEILDANYEMIDSDGEYFSREDREEYHAIFQNPVTGDQVAVVVTPIPDEAGVVTNHIEMIVGNADNNPVTRDRIAHEVAERLRASGVEGCSFPCAGRYGDDTAQEVVRVGNISAVEAGNEQVRAAKPAGTAAGNDIQNRVTRRTEAN